MVSSKLRGSKRGILTATILGSSLVFIDSTVVNVITPRLQTEFAATAGQIQWIVEAYLLFLSALILLGGALGDRYGRKRVFEIGTVIFIFASLACGISHSLIQMAVARSIQGIGGALLTPGSLAILNGAFPKEERGRTIGTWSGFSAMTAALGPVLGGWLADHASWRWVFLINLPLGLLTLYFTRRFVPEQCGEMRSQSRAVKLDIRGALTSVLALMGITFGLIESSQFGPSGMTSPRVIIPLCVGVLLFAFFFRTEAKRSNALLPLSIFHSRTFVAANLCTLFLYAALGSVFYFLPFNLIQIQGFTATETGAANLPFVIFLFLFSRASGGLYDRFGPRLPLTIGSIIVGVSFLLLGFLPGLHSSYWTKFFPELFLFGVGMSLCVAPLTSTVLGSVPVEHSGLSSGFNNAVARLAGLIAIAVMTTFVLASFQNHLGRRMESVDISASQKRSINHHATQLAAIAAPPEAREQIKRSYLDSFRELMEVCCALSFGSAFVAFSLPSAASLSVKQKVLP
jgi:EmrB/QacA subfamily drug resistance transporter